MKNTKKGFTLVELLVVIAILAILASVAVVGYTAFIDKAEESNAKTEAHQIKTSITSALVVPDDVYTIAEDGTNKYTIKLVNGKYQIFNNNVQLKTNDTLSIDLDSTDANFKSDFKGLKGVLTIVGGNLVYDADNGAANQIIVAVELAS